jgi:hypothetical protein
MRVHVRPRRALSFLCLAFTAIICHHFLLLLGGEAVQNAHPATVAVLPSTIGADSCRLGSPRGENQTSSFLDKTELRGVDGRHVHASDPRECCTVDPSCAGFTFNSEEELCRFKTLESPSSTLIVANCDACTSFTKAHVPLTRGRTDPQAVRSAAAGSPRACGGAPASSSVDGVCGVPTYLAPPVLPWAGTGSKANLGGCRWLDAAGDSSHFRAFTAAAKIRGEKCQGVATAQADGPSDCCEQCTKDTSCAGFTFNHEEKLCHFKAAATGVPSTVSQCDVCTSFLKMGGAPAGSVLDKDVLPVVL